jgi:hypothetical protein
MAPAGSTANAPASAPAVSGQSGAGGFLTGAGTGRGAAPSARSAAKRAAFFAAAQHDFAARLKWSVTPQYKDANHEPIVKIAGARDLEARPGATVRLRGLVSDPDRNRVTIRWWQDNDAGAYPGDVTIADASAADTMFRVPENARPGQTIHLILEVTDDGVPTLTRYQRVVVAVGR